MYYSQHEDVLRVARLKTLQEHLDELMISQGHYREAFTLIILVFKGVNFSFKFSFSCHDLKNCIFSAVECTISSLISSMDSSIVEYRVAWICQLLLETNNESMLWTVVYKKLKEKSKELCRLREGEGRMHEDERKIHEDNTRMHEDNTRMHEDERRRGQNTGNNKKGL